VPSVSLPVLPLSLRAQRYSCHGCGNCCRDFTVQLRDDDLRKLREQQWEQKLGGPVTIGFRGVTYLRQREDGACVFLMDDGRCRIHHEFGFAAKPIACQLFPFHLTPGAHGIVQGLNFACQSVLENKGAELRTHGGDLGRMAGELQELRRGRAVAPLLADRLPERASEIEERALTEHADQWLADDELSLPVRLDGLAWVAQSLARAQLQNVRGSRFADLLDVLFAALPDELEHHPLEPATPRLRRMLRQAVFARTEDPKLGMIARQGRWRITLAQLSRNRRFKSGRGAAPRIGPDWGEADLRDVESIDPARDLVEAQMIDDLLTRWLRATVLGGRAWGAGYYGWSMVAGLQALLLNAACVAWLARLHAAGRVGRPAATDAPGGSLGIVDVRAALGRIDRTAGRAKWLGSSAERLRLAYLNMHDGLRRLLAGYPVMA